MEKNWIDPVISWEISVLDDFTGAVITFNAVPPDGDEMETYACRPTGWRLPQLRQFQKEIEGLIGYMESGGTRLPGSRQ